MTARPSRIASGPRTGLSLIVALALVLLLFIGSGVLTYVNIRSLSEATQSVTHTHEVLTALADVISLMKDAETGQRGYLITGQTSYLDPHYVAIGNPKTGQVGRVYERLDEIARLSSDNKVQVNRLRGLRNDVDFKIVELRNTVDVRTNEGFEAAQALVVTDRGKQVMDSIRERVEEMQDTEREQRALRLRETEAAYGVAIAGVIATGVLGSLLSLAVAYLVQRATAARERQDWLQSGLIGLSTATAGDLRLERLGESMLSYLSEYLNAQAGAFYARDEGHFVRAATYGVPAVGGAPERFTLDDGLLGQAAKDARTFIVADVPEGYLTLGSALGQGKPRHLLIVPMVDDGVVNAVIELGFMQPVDNDAIALFEKASEAIGVSVQAANYRARLQNFLEETQRQAEELQAQAEELRVSNEELEEQGRALRESQARLEQQQAELEQTNTQLEEQTLLLESQRDDVTRAKSALQVQAQELEQASRYKSDFLANMSHELRTPLNSSLILAKLLADNTQGNLTTEQVKYAETIQSSGNDLLALINDILDLSKIEAGHMEVRPQSAKLSQILEDIARTFRPVAEQKKLTFRTQLLPGCPEVLDTDRQRLEQVLKNLLSNAMKFTEHGEVTLTVSPAPDKRVSFAVADTGIGIPEHQQKVVFEAFRQADGTINRKYGGTGLGLSISRELARLLGGEIHLASEAGKGSTFTVTVPIVYDPNLVQHGKSALASAIAESQAVAAAPIPNAPIRETPAMQPASAPIASFPMRRVEDDRERLTGDRRTILVVEDDEPFARILYDLAHELDFQCLIATTAEEGLAVAVQLLPSAVVLDVGLPDHSGLSVLDRLKRDARTRHIPVHVVSAGDYAQTALSLGAVGYMLKPVKRDELAAALKRLETRLETRMRRVLVVEDDPVQRDSLGKLLGSHDVQTVGVGSAGECLAQLRQTTFDCMVLDLSLPDASGYSLLETLSREDAYSFPPVIVYTGRDLSVDEEQRLRRYSKSIIIKGAKSPERLLDEVTLFLHQVVSELPVEQQKMIEKARGRDSAIEGRRILIVEDDVRNVFALTSILEPRGAVVQIARNGREGLTALEKANSAGDKSQAIDLVLMDVMMPEMDGLVATREIRKRPEWKKLPVIMLTAKAMKDDQERCLDAGANDYMSKPLDVEKLLSLIRVWMPR